MNETQQGVLLLENQLWRHITDHFATTEKLYCFIPYLMNICQKENRARAVIFKNTESELQVAVAFLNVSAAYHRNRKDMVCQVLSALQGIKFPVQRQESNVIKQHYASYQHAGFNLGEWQQQQPPGERFFLRPFPPRTRYFTQTGPILSVCEEGNLRDKGVTALPISHNFTQHNRHLCEGCNHESFKSNCLAN